MLYRKHAAFLMMCKKPAEAIRKLLDAMINLNRYLRAEATDGTPYPEQKNCVKFTDDYYNLKKYYTCRLVPNCLSLFRKFNQRPILRLE